MTASVWNLNASHPGMAFIQWKGTDVCMDLHCTVCQHHNHYDTDFAYFVQCAKCKTVFEMNCFVQFRPMLPKDASNYSAQNPKQSNCEEDGT
jgi:hypothetical protein